MDSPIIFLQFDMQTALILYELKRFAPICPKKLFSDNARK